jgi:hypothetical protein
LEEEYLRTAAPDELGGKATEGEGEEGTGAGQVGTLGTGLENLDEKVMEVLRQDLFESVP